MSIADRAHRDLSGLYDEEELFSTEPLGAGPEAEQADRTVEELAPARRTSPRFGPRARPLAMLLGGGAGVLAVLAVHMHATVGRPVGPQLQRRPAPRPVRIAPRERRTVSSRRTAAAEGRGQRRRARLDGRTAPTASTPVALPVRRSPAAARPSQEFGFER
jgi:hypothetical protein